MNVKTAIAQGTELTGSRLTAEVLLGHAMHHDRVWFYAHPEQELREVEWLHYGRYLHERLKGKPTQYITHKQEFFGRDFRVTPDVLIPRPESELLVETVLKAAPDAALIIDACTGSGAIGITLALESRARIIATDISSAALTVAAANAQNLSAALSFVEADLLQSFSPNCADIIVSNPPYIAETDRATLQPEVRDWEPSLALFAGPGGTDIYKRLIPQARSILKSGGILALELGFGQKEALSALIKGWNQVRFLDDLAGIPRVLVCNKP